MPEPVEYKFKIDVFTPDTMPMSRLAQYMAELAALMGHENSVHFVRLEPGSAVLVQRIDAVDAPKVRQRLTESRTDDAPRDVREKVINLNRMLRADNAAAELIQGDRAEVIPFPGRNQPLPEPIGPFNQHTEIDGILVRIGGTDQTAHAQIIDAEQRVWGCVLTREQARELATYLYGQPVRLSGSGRWQRDAEGNWNLVRLKVAEFHALQGAPLDEMIKKLRSIPGNNWLSENDPLGILSKLRGDDHEIH